MTLLPRLPARCGSVENIPFRSRPLPAPVEVGSTPPSPRPILALPGPQATLYVELIQASLHNLAAGSPALLWVRPLLLRQGSQVFNLRATSDLLWPAAGFVPAYAEEVLPLLEQARDPAPHELPARQQLQAFLRQVWRG
ncbi:hypothetical protein ACVW0B_001837 [Thermostichus sp. MS-CIW-23]|jgi:hypothetical protein|uniref:hypothetical protein n=1 Tax=Synechococcus sp. R5-12 TaxID=2421321 RepID=UPI0039C652CC